MTASEPTVAERLGTFAHDLRFEDLPRAVVEKLRVVTLHNLGMALAGYPAAKPFWNSVRRRAASGEGTASLLIEGRRVAAHDAAFANGVLIHARAQDDVNLPATTHVGCTVFPAALAVAEAYGRTGAEFVAAVVAGYEIAGAAGRVGSHRSTPRGFRATPIYGPLGAAAAAAKLMGLSIDQTREAIAIATSFSGGLNQTWVDGSMEWRFQVGQAARSGILAAELAADGGVGARYAFEGAVGFFHAFAGDRSLAAICGAELGKTWETLAVTFKPYPVCALLQTPVTALVRLVRQHGLTADQVARLRLYLNPFEAAYPGIDGPGPFADVGATLMSAQFCLGAALTHGEVRLPHLYRFAAPEYERLWPRIAILAQEGFGPGSCRIEVTTTDGRTLAEELIPGPDTFNFTAAEEADLIRGLGPEIALSAERLEAFIDVCLRVDTLPSVRSLLDATRTSAAVG